MLLLLLLKEKEEIVKILTILVIPRPTRELIELCETLSTCQNGASAIRVCALSAVRERAVDSVLVVELGQECADPARLREVSISTRQTLFHTHTHIATHTQFGYVKKDKGHTLEDFQRVRDASSSK